MFSFIHENLKGGGGGGGLQLKLCQTAGKRRPHDLVTQKLMIKDGGGGGGGGGGGY